MTTNSYTQNQSDLLHAQGQDTILRIAYSNSGYCPPNTIEHFITMARFGFNALKGDVELTRDHQLIMCHDEGYTINTAPNIIASVMTKGSKKNQYIKDLDLNDILEYTFGPLYLGHSVHPCTFEDYIKVCVEHDVIPYITIRDREIDTYVVPKILEVLRKYNLINKAIIACYNGSFKSSAPYIKMVRELDKDVMTCIVMGADEELTKPMVDCAIVNGNCAISLFTDPSGKKMDLAGSKDAIDYAVENGVRIFNAQVGRYSRYIENIEKKISGMQLTKPMFHIGKTMYPLKITYIPESRHTVKRIEDILDKDGNVVGKKYIFWEDDVELEKDAEDKFEKIDKNVVLKTKATGNTDANNIEVGDKVSYIEFKEWMSDFAFDERSMELIKDESQEKMHIKLCDFKRDGSGRDFGDMLLDVWFVYFPYSLSVKGKNETEINYTFKQENVVEEDGRTYKKYVLTMDVPNSADTEDFSVLFETI